MRAAHFIHRYAVYFNSSAVDCQLRFFFEKRVVSASALVVQSVVRVDCFYGFAKTEMQPMSRFQQCDEVGFRGLGFEYRRVDYVYICFAACLIHSRIHTRKNKFAFRIGLVRCRLSDENFRFGIGIGFGEFDGGVESVFELVAR